MSSKIKEKNRKNSKNIKLKRKGKNSQINELVLLGVIFMFLGFLSCQGFVFYKYKQENDRLNSLKSEYVTLIKEMESYKQLKGQYEIVLSDGSNLNDNKKKLEDDVKRLNNDISSLEKMIVDINKKIKNLS